MKILITTDLYTTATNGVVTSVKNLVEELEKLGHEIKILTFSQKAKSYKKDNLYFIRSMSFPVYPDVRMPLSYYHKYVRELIQWKPQVIHSQCEFFSYQFASRISKKTGAPIIHTYHTLYEQYAKYVVPSQRLGNRIVKWFSRVRLKKSRVVIAPTRKVEAALRGYGLKNQIEVLPTGISLDQHKSRLSQEQRETMRQDLGIGKDQQVLINLGRLGNEKNLQELVSFFHAAQEAHPDLRFLIVGGGPAKESLEKLSQSLNIADKVIFAGMIDPKRVQEYYQLGDIFVSASTSETQGLTYVEAAANGLPLLCRKDPCLDDVIQDGQNGYQYQNQEEFLLYLDRMLADPDWQTNAGQISQSVAETFSKEAFGNRVHELYRSISQ